MNTAASSKAPRLFKSVLIAANVVSLASVVYFAKPFQDYYASSPEKQHAMRRELAVKAHTPAPTPFSFKHSGGTVCGEVYGFIGGAKAVVLINADTLSAGAEVARLLSGVPVVTYKHVGMHVDHSALLKSRSPGSKERILCSGAAPTSDEESSELSAVLNHLQVQSDVVLVSYNFNWLATLKAAARNPSFIRGVLLVDPLLPSANLQAGVRVPLPVAGEPEIRLRRMFSRPVAAWVSPPKQWNVPRYHLSAEDLWREYLYRESLFSTPEFQRPSMVSLLDQSTLMAATNMLFAISVDPRVEYLYQQQSCLKIENKMLLEQVPISKRTASVMSVVPVPPTRLTSACAAFVTESYKDAPLPVYTHADNHRALLSLVLSLTSGYAPPSSKNPSGAKSAPNVPLRFPVLVRVSRIPEKMIPRISVDLSWVFSSLSSQNSNAVVVARSQLFQYSTWLAKEWDAVLPGLVSWIPTRMPPDEAIGADSRCVVMAIEELLKRK